MVRRLATNIVVRLWCCIVVAVNVVWLMEVTALAPPHHEYTEWESVHAQRRRLGIQYGYTPLHISAEHCRYLTEDECERLDHFVGGEGDNEQPSVGQQQQRQRLLRTSQHPKTQRRRRQSRLNPSLGHGIRVLVLLMRFKDFDESVYGPLPPREFYELLFNSEGPTEANPVGSVRDYLRYNSLGKYDVTFDVRDWVVTEKTEAEYAGGTFGANQPLQEIFMSTLTQWDEANAISWEDGYIAPDGMLNHLVVLTSGFAAEAGNRPCLPIPVEDRLWSNGSKKAYDQDAYWKSKDDYYVSHWCLASAVAMPACNRTTGELNPVRGAAIGVIVHEYLHGFGLPDLYDLSGELPMGGIGKFGVMSSLQGWDFSFDTPAHMSCWSRQQIQWNEPIEIVRDGYYAVQPLQMSNSCYKITHNFPVGEYLLIENKQPLKWDAGVRQGGIVIYHIDYQAEGQMHRGYPGSPGWPEMHYEVAIVQADTLFSIEKGDDMGEVGDFFIRGSKLGPGPEQPNTDSYQFGIVQPTGVTIEVITNSSFIMLFRVTGISTRSGSIQSLLDSEATSSEISTTSSSIGSDIGTTGSTSATADGLSNSSTFPLSTDGGNTIPLGTMPTTATTNDSTGKAIERILALFGGLSLLLTLMFFFFFV